MLRKSSWTLKQLAETLNLPITAFSQRADYKEMENRLRKVISTDLYQKQSSTGSNPEFLIHDGPPFANGDLHIGHVLNKMLKDTILRYHIGRRQKVIFRPGWDCHGLPIEQKALIRLKTAERDPLQIRKICREFAQDAIQRQRADMEKWGLLADYDQAVITMDPQYEARQLEIFAKFVEQGLVYHDKQPISWSPSSKTALAEAELEYKDDHLSKACFVRFPIVGKTNEYLLIWTTAPWTIPANQAIAINPLLRYLKVATNDDISYVVAESRVEYLSTAIGLAITRIEPILSEELLSLKFMDIRNPKQYNPVLPANFIADDVGTGVVHLAPAYGYDDFVVCRKHGIVEIEMVDEGGYYNDQAPNGLQGKRVIDTDGITAAMQFVRSKGMLVHSQDWSHRYPYDWRTNKPVIQMATRQWFVNVAPIKGIIVKALESVEFVPESGRRRLISMIENRNEWCISRQRYWGVPIPVFYHKDNSKPVLDAENIKHFANLVKIYGTDAWWQLSTRELLLERYRNQSENLVKGNDTLDVWFDSGTFWSTDADRCADVYIEGADQFRGWFQSSLIISVLMRGYSPFKKVISHGFVLDENGTKMSKSVGNVISPAEIISPSKTKSSRSTDVLRIWAVSVNFLNDVKVGVQSIAYATDLHQRLRNAIRFILGNMSGFGSFENDNANNLWVIDQLIMAQTNIIEEKITKHFGNYDFAKGLEVLQEFIKDDLSAIYFDCIKNRIYLEPMESENRQSAQSALAYIYQSLLRVIQPIAPFLCAEAASHFPSEPDHCGQTLINGHNTSLEILWRDITCLRSSVIKELQELRRAGVIESTFQAILGIDGLNQTSLDPSTLTELFMVTKVVFGQLEGSPLLTLQLRFRENYITISVHKSEGEKCPRCWVYIAENNSTLCRPCTETLGKLGRRASFMQV